MSALEIYVYVRVNHKKYVKIFLCKWWCGNERISLLCDGVNYVLAASCCNCQRNNVAALRAAKTFGCVEISWQLPTGSRAKICIPNKTGWDGWQAPGKNVNLVHDALTTTTRLLCRYISQSASESESNPNIQPTNQPSSRAACHKAIKQEAWHFNLQAERRRASWFEEPKTSVHLKKFHRIILKVGFLSATCEKFHSLIIKSGC